MMTVTARVGHAPVRFGAEDETRPAPRRGEICAMRRLAMMLLALACLGATKQEEILERDRLLAEAGGWIYNDLTKGLALARASGKPLLVVLRCPT